MTLRTFFSYIERTKKLPESTVICFSGNTYPLLFFYHLFCFLKNNGVVIDHINCIGNTIASIKALLSTMSFTGTTTYWLENFYTLPSKKQQELLAYLKIYNGPHRIVFFSDDMSIASSSGVASSIDSIALPEKIAPHDFSMVRFLVKDSPGNVKAGFAQNIAQLTDHLSLDSACLFAHYEIVVGKNSDDFFVQWMSHIIEPTSSLFVLSQQLFSKKPTLFFQQWTISSGLYMPSFWPNFWADQIWRAYVFCSLMKNKNHVQAKKAQYKLPFSFINRDWSSYTAAELRNAHHFLSTMDFRLKNGCSEIGMEHFYAQFFEGKFR